MVTRVASRRIGVNVLQNLMLERRSFDNLDAASTKEQALLESEPIGTSGTCLQSYQDVQGSLV